MDAATPREKPFFIAHDCPHCQVDLVLVDAGKPSHEAWYDEWVCPDEDCPMSDGIFLDWSPEDYKAFIQEAKESKEEGTISMEELIEELGLEEDYVITQGGRGDC